MSEDNILPFDVDFAIIGVIKEHRANTATMAREIVILRADLAAARARIAELEADLKYYHGYDWLIMSHEFHAPPAPPEDAK